MKHSLARCTFLFLIALIAGAFGAGCATYDDDAETAAAELAVASDETCTALCNAQYAECMANAFDEWDIFFCNRDKRICRSTCVLAAVDDVASDAEIAGGAVPATAAEDETCGDRCRDSFFACIEAGRRLPDCQSAYRLCGQRCMNE